MVAAVSFSAEVEVILMEVEVEVEEEEVVMEVEVEVEVEGVVMEALERAAAETAAARVVKDRSVIVIQQEAHKR